MTTSKELSIVAMLGHTSHKMGLMLDRYFRKRNPDINVEQFVLLNILRANDGINQQNLSRMLDKDKTTIARLVSKMEKNNLLLRVHSREDKRSNNIYITNYGKEVLLELGPIIKQIQQAFVKDLSEEEIVLFFSVLNKISNEIIELDKVVNTTK